MKYLALALLLCALLSLTKAQCSHAVLPPGTTHCQDPEDKTWHAVGSKWRTSTCWDCTCTGCCPGYATPVRFPEDCVSVFDSTTCKYIVHKKDDPSVLCPVFAAM